MHQKVKTETNIKVIKLINGDDIVCNLPQKELQLPDNSPLLRLERPLQIKYVPQMTPMGFRDYIAMIRWTNYTNDKIVTIPKDKIMTITNASSEMAVNYSQIVKNYDKLDKPKKDENYHRKEFTANENEKLNEIFRELDDVDEEDPTIH